MTIPPWREAGRRVPQRRTFLWGKLEPNNESRAEGVPSLLVATEGQRATRIRTNRLLTGWAGLSSQVRTRFE